MAKLTNTQIKNLKPHQSKDIHVHDGNYLYLRIYKSGSKSWVVRYRYNDSNNKQQLLTHTIGKYPTISLKEARILGAKIVDNYKEGVLPNKSTARDKLNSALDNTFNNWAQRWLPSKSNLTPKTISGIKGRLSNHIYPYIGSKHISSITSSDIANLLFKLQSEKAPDTANRCKQIISQVYDFYLLHSGDDKRNPVSIIPQNTNPTPQKNHPTLLDPDEIGGLLRKIDTYQLRGDFLTCKALLLLPYLALRPGELYSLKWSYINFEKSLIEIPAEKMKARRTHLVPIAPAPLEIFKELHKVTNHLEFIFGKPSNKKKHLSENATTKALERLGYKNKIVPHGFRHMFSTLLNEQGYKSTHIEKQLAHEDKNTIRGTYNKAEYLQERIIMMNEWAEYLKKLKNNLT